MPKQLWKLYEIMKERVIEVISASMGSKDDKLLKSEACKLWPTLKLAKSLPEYKDRSKLDDDKLVINGISYTLDGLHQLPSNLAANKAAEKGDNSTILF